jgi:hypothetical protein
MLEPLVNEGTILCTDGDPSYRAFTRDRGIRHFVLSDRESVKQGIYHIQSVNGYHSRLKEWMRPFRGVATKYLENYLALHRFIDLHENRPQALVKSELLQSSCVQGTVETCRSLREAGFRIDRVDINPPE